ncbi:hypothetical protein AB0I28_20890 [Phytomonospora sp. NPDC050363]|uniref:5-carboxymethyl-2-hydroxymuconate Delta-isomerase n=1 Tax=Phytomonospora sp. NPDC050363 TaxID=3155642 RepID=UPI0033FAA4DF
MPQIVVSYSDTMLRFLDRVAFARELHHEAAKIIDAPLDDFKTRFLPIETWVIGDHEQGEQLVHVDFAILTGRNEETRAELARKTLEVLRAGLTDDVTDDVAARVHLTVEVREMDRPAFAKHITT